MESARRSKVLSVGEGESKRRAVPFIDQPGPASIYTHQQVPSSLTLIAPKPGFPLERGGGRAGAWGSPWNPDPKARQAASARFRSAGPTRANSAKGRRCAVTPPDAEIVGLAPPRLRSGLARRRMGGSARGPIASPRGVRWVGWEGLARGGVAGPVCCQLVVGLCSLTEEGGQPPGREREPGVGVYIQIHHTPVDAAAEGA